MFTARYAAEGITVPLDRDSLWTDTPSDATPPVHHPSPPSPGGGTISHRDLGTTG